MAQAAAERFGRALQPAIVQALVGDGQGRVDVPGRGGWIYIRLHGDPNSVVEAFNSAAGLYVENQVVDVQKVARTGSGYYEILGLSTVYIYNLAGSGSITGTHAYLKKHGDQHERRDRDVGGFDPVDVFARMMADLRARPQDEPDLTLYVTEGRYAITGHKFWGGGSSPEFRPPIGWPSKVRYDLLYLGADDNLHILEGIADIDVATKPEPPEFSVPIAWVHLRTGMTSITGDEIEDARFFADSVPKSGLYAKTDAIFILGTADPDLPRGVALTGIQLGGDLEGTLPNPMVAGLRGYDVTGNPPAADQVLTWDSGISAWKPAMVGATDPNAIHVNVGNEIAGIAEKTSPVNADLLVIEDSAASYAKKRLQIGNLPGGTGGHIIQDEGVSLPQRAKLNFVGGGVTATDDAANNATAVTIPDGNTPANVRAAALIYAYYNFK